EQLFDPLPVGPHPVTSSIGDRALNGREFRVQRQVELKRTVMPTAVTELPVLKEPRRKRWTRSECDALAESGVLDCQKLELIEGELIDKMGKNRPHVNSQTLLMGWLLGVFGMRMVIPESPIDVSPEDN